MFDEGIEAFWQWWEDGGRGRLEAAIAGADATTVVAEISDLVADIHPALEWQLAPGVAAQHSLALSGGGLGTLRIIAQRWVDAAPEPGGTWEFHPARIPVQPQPITVAEVDLDPSTFVFTAEPDPLYEQLDLSVYMAGFEDLDDESRMHAILNYLDATLGEDDSETWIGVIIPLAAPPSGGRPLDDLPEAVADLAATATGEGWEVIEREEFGELSIATVNRAVKHLQHLDHVLHLEIEVKMNELTPLGMPTDVEAADQEEIEEDAVATVGKVGIFFARETVSGHRHLHFFVRDIEGIGELIEEWAEEFDSHVVTPHITLDPDWSVLNRWL